MEQNHSQLRHRHEEQQESTAVSQNTETESVQGQEFASPEEAIRFDAAQTPLPPAIADRLRSSLAKEPKTRRSWWRRWTGDDSTPTGV
jgi:hypothetical protein